MKGREAACFLITGAAGFIGNQCVNEFLRRGERVGAIVHQRRNPTWDQAAANGRLYVAEADIAERASFLRAAQLCAEKLGSTPSALIHCAAFVSDVGPVNLFRRTNLDGVGHACDVVKALGIGRLVFISTTDVYGLKDLKCAGEDTPLAVGARNPYPKYKILAERAVTGNLPQGQYVILRPAAVWGPGDMSIHPRVAAFLSKTPAIFHFGKWRGRNRWPMAYVGNVAKAAYLSSTRDEAAGRVFNVVDPEFTTADQFYRIVLDACSPSRNNIASVTLPYWAGWIIAAVSSGSCLLLRRRKPLFDPTLYSLHAASRNLDIDGSRIQSFFSQCDEEFVPRAEALETFRAWCKAAALHASDATTSV